MSGMKKSIGNRSSVVERFGIAIAIPVRGPPDRLDKELTNEIITAFCFGKIGLTLALVYLVCYDIKV